MHNATTPNIELAKALIASALLVSIALVALGVALSTSSDRRPM
jgi:VIT1/CCC1 family predicted Fe2+/Mn2+ transporter